MDGSQSPGSIHVTFGKTNFLIEDEQDPGTWIEEELEAKKADFIDEILNGNLPNGKASKILYIITRCLFTTIADSNPSNVIRGRSKTMFTKFGFFRPPTPLRLYFPWFQSLQKIDFF